LVVVTVMAAAKTPTAIPTTATRTREIAGTFFVVKRLSLTRRLLIFQSLDPKN
jgi:hypothetical protein